MLQKVPWKIYCLPSVLVCIKIQKGLDNDECLILKYLTKSRYIRKYISLNIHYYIEVTSSWASTVCCLINGETGGE